MKELEVDGMTIYKQANLSHYISHFYTNMYTYEPHSPNIVEAQKKCWESVPSQVTEDMNAAITRELTLEEVVEAITSLPKGKALGHDNLLIEFFQENVEKTTPTLLLAFRAMLSLGLISNFLNKGIITLIPKYGDHSKLGNWRPITLLRNIYKILVKILAQRIEVYLPFVIRPNQTSFVMGKNILDNNFLAQESFKWAIESEHDLILLLLNFEKTFDRIKRGFFLQPCPN